GGKTYRSEVWLRLRNADHQSRFRTLKRRFPARELQVSHGILDQKQWEFCSSRYPSAKRIDEIESLLIYSNHFNEYGINARKHRAHGITDHYMLTNKGHYKPLKRQVYLTTFERIN